MNEDYAYNTPFKRIWNRKKGHLAIGQCFNAFDLVRPSLGKGLMGRSDEPPAIRPAKLSKRQFKRILADYEDPVDLSGKPMNPERLLEKQK